MESRDTVIGYASVRVEEQGADGVALEVQRAAIEAGCARRGWQLLRIEEEVLGGNWLNRPGLWAALDACRSGEADGLVVSKLDRLSRSTLDFAAVLDDARQRGFNVVALDLGLDLSTPQGELVANVIACVARWERRRIIREALAVERGARRRAAVPVHVAGARHAVSARDSLIAAGRRARTAAVPVARRAWRDGARRLELARPPARDRRDADRDPPRRLPRSDRSPRDEGGLGGARAGARRPLPPAADGAARRTVAQRVATGARLWHEEEDRHRPRRLAARGVALAVAPALQL